MSAISSAKNILRRQIIRGEIFDDRFPYIKHSKFHLTTNENIGAYLKTLSKDSKSALSILSSGDHVFNLIHKGILSIDAFDSNRLTEYYALGVKRAMIEKYDYEEFIITLQKFYSQETSLTEITEILSGLLNYMDEPYRGFWRKLIEYNYKKQKNSDHPLNIMLMLSTESYFLSREQIIRRNEYLKSKEDYENLRNLLGKANINFKSTDACYLEKAFNGMYDTILLSNILDYFMYKWGQYYSYNELEHYLKALKQMLNDNGVLFINYNFFNGGNTVIKDSAIVKDDLKDEEILIVPSVTFNRNDTVLLVRKKEMQACPTTKE